MFSLAIKKASRFTRPLLTIRGYHDGTTDCGCGAFVVLNDEGWIATAAHLFGSYEAYRQHLRERDFHSARVRSIVPDPARRARGGSGRPRANPRWITSHSFWWGAEGVRIEDTAFLPEGDLAIGRLVPFARDPDMIYPVLKNPGTLDVGQSLCKLGFPFNRLDARLDDTDGSLALAPGVLPLTIFPIEGIYTRTLVAGRSADGKYEIKFLETSSPGLMGQSGGPVFDRDGTVWAIQSRTDIHPMCASVLEGRGGRKVRESHFLETGVGIHPELVAAFLSDHGVRFSVSDN